MQQIIVNDENHVKIGNTFPRRAKQLVSKQKAKWLDTAHTEIILMPTETKGTKTNTDVISLTDKIVKEEYRDSESVILRSSPLEIIKKSKRRTRELHTAVSLVLWVSAAIVYLLLNFILGNTNFTLNPAELSSTWLIFVFAALFECLLEVYFCNKELDVLNENIDLRQINPLKKDGDLDLFAYQKKLKFKIRLMQSAAIWIPLVLIFFLSGYLFGIWGVTWIVFLFGLLFEVLLNLIRKLKQKEIIS